MTLALKRTDFALDIGSSRVRVYEAGKGVVLDVPIEELIDEAAIGGGDCIAAASRAALVRVGARKCFVSRIKRAVLAVPSSIGEVQKRAFEEAARRAGAPEVFLVESPMAAAIGAREEVSAATATTVVDVGASRIQVAVISLAGIVAVHEAARASEVSADRIADLVRDAITACLAKERFNLADDIARRGIVLTGGGAQTPGLAEALQTALDLPVRVADEPQLAVIRGAGVVLGSLDELRRLGLKAPTDWKALCIFLVFILLGLKFDKISAFVKGIFSLFAR